MSLFPIYFRQTRCSWDSRKYHNRPNLKCCRIRLSTSQQQQHTQINRSTCRCKTEIPALLLAGRRFTWKEGRRKTEGTRQNRMFLTGFKHTTISFVDHVNRKRDSWKGLPTLKGPLRGGRTFLQSAFRAIGLKQIIWLKESRFESHICRILRAALVPYNGVYGKT